MDCFPPASHVDILSARTSEGAALGDRLLTQVVKMRSPGWASLLEEEIRTQTHTEGDQPSTLQGGSPRKKPSLDLRLRPPEIRGKNAFLLFKLPGLWVFVTMASSD